MKKRRNKPNKRTKKNLPKNRSKIPTNIPGQSSDTEGPLAGLGKMPQSVFNNIVAVFIGSVVLSAMILIVNEGRLQDNIAFPALGILLIAVGTLWSDRHELLGEKKAWGALCHLADWTMVMLSILSSAAINYYFGRYTEVGTFNGMVLIIMLFWGFAMLIHVMWASAPKDN